MKTKLSLILLAILALAGCSQEMTQPDPTPAVQKDTDLALDGNPALPDGGDRLSLASGRAVIANRGSGTISVIDAQDLVVTGTYDLPAEGGEPTPEPMYVVSVRAMSRVFVGDRANDRVAVFDSRTFAVEGTASAGAGVFHMWADPQGKQLWVNNDIDNTSTVIDPKTLAVIMTVPTPADLVGMGGKPHDVILGPNGDYAYVTVLGVAGPNDYVVQFSTSDFTETARAAVGKDPHLSLARQHNWLYVPCQNSNQVVVLNRMTLAEETVLDVPGAHGAGMTPNGKFFYTANLPGGGSNALYAIDTTHNTLAGMPADTPYPVPHNIAFNAQGKRLFLTHSGGTADKVTVYRVSKQNPTAEYIGEVTVGLNPFGLAFVR